MKLDVIRYTGRGSSLGIFMVDGKFECYTLEDAFHVVKIPGETRIPEGTYRVELRTYGGHHDRYKVKFPEFHKGMLQVMDVPNYTDILIHIGNSDDDTEGCLLVGDKSISNLDNPGRIESSTNAYKRMYPKVANRIAAGDQVLISYRDITQML